MNDTTGPYEAEIYEEEGLRNDIFEYIAANPMCTTNEMSEHFGIEPENVRYYIGSLRHGRAGSMRGRPTSGPDDPQPIANIADPDRKDPMGRPMRCWKLVESGDDEEAAKEFNSFIYRRIEGSSRNMTVWDHAAYTKTGAVVLDRQRVYFQRLQEDIEFARQQVES